MLLYIKELIPAFVVQLQLEADCNEATWYKLVTRHTTLTIGVVHRCPNVTKPNNETIHNYMLQYIRTVRKGDSIIIGESRENGILHYRAQG